MKRLSAICGCQIETSASAIQSKTPQSESASLPIRQWWSSLVSNICLTLKRLCGRSEVMQKRRTQLDMRGQFEPSSASALFHALYLILPFSPVFENTTSHFLPRLPVNYAALSNIFSLATDGILVDYRQPSH